MELESKQARVEAKAMDDAEGTVQAVVSVTNIVDSVKENCSLAIGIIDGTSLRRIYILQHGLRHILDRQEHVFHTEICTAAPRLKGPLWLPRHSVPCALDLSDLCRELNRNLCESVESPPDSAPELHHGSSRIREHASDASAPSHGSCRWSMISSCSAGRLVVLLMRSLLVLPNSNCLLLRRN